MSRRKESAFRRGDRRQRIGNASDRIVACLPNCDLPIRLTLPKDVRFRRSAAAAASLRRMLRVLRIPPTRRENDAQDVVCAGGADLSEVMAGAS